MAWLFLLLKAVVLLPSILILKNAINLFRNYLAARKIGFPIQIAPINPMNPFWGLIDNRVLPFMRFPPFHLDDNNFSKCNWRCGEVKDRNKSHEEMGKIWTLVTPSYNFVYLSDPATATSMYERHADLHSPAFISS